MNYMSRFRTQNITHFRLGGAEKMNSGEEKVAQMKKIFDVKTDEELANKMGVSIFTVRNWKQRGDVPKKYELKILEEHGVRLSDTKILNNTNSVIVNGLSHGNITNGYQTEVSKELMEFIELFKEYGNSEMISRWRESLVEPEELNYVMVLLKAYVDNKLLRFLKSRLLKNKYGVYFDDKVEADDVGIIIEPSSGFESEFEVSLNLIEKKYRKKIGREASEKLTVEWLDDRIPAKVLWEKLGVKLEEARLWRYELKIPEERLKQIAKKLDVSLEDIDGAKFFEERSR